MIIFNQPKRVKERYLVEQNETISCVAFLNDIYLLTGPSDASIILWDIHKEDLSHSMIHKFNDHNNSVSCIDYSEYDGNIFISGSADTTARMWDIRQKHSCTRIFDESHSIINCVKFMPNSKFTVAVGGDDFFIRLYDIRALGKISLYEDKSSESVSSVCFSKSGRLLFSACNSQQIKVFDTLKEVKIDPLPIAHDKQVKCLGICMT